MQRGGHADPEACYIIWVGINDYYFHLIDKRYAFGLRLPHLEEAKAKPDLQQDAASEVDC